MLFKELHQNFITNLAKGTSRKNFEYWVTEHLRLSGTYWGLMAIYCIDKVHDSGIPWDEILEWVKSCQNEDGGFGGNVGHDSHMLYTLSAVQVFFQLDRLDELPNHEKIAQFVAGERARVVHC